MKFYITFGQLSPARNGVVEIEAPSETDARLYANAHVKDEFAYWCSCHSEDEWANPEVNKFYPLGVLRSIEIGRQSGGQR